MVTGEECYLKRVYRKFSQKCFKKFKKYFTMIRVFSKARI